MQPLLYVGLFLLITAQPVRSGCDQTECVEKTDGRDYDGKWSRTQSGRTCQSWSSQSPHKHGFTSLPNNYCRNPDGEPGVWCYTTDPQKRWELCGLPICECVKAADGIDYNGRRDKTQSGRTCQPWFSQFPHKHKFTSLPNNYCRNPDGEPGAWCYTTDPQKRWELCGVPVCECVKTADGRDYDGKRDKTQSGRTCQSWSSQYPHKHKFTSLPKNYCRNPDGEPGAWCYTTDPKKRWELCGVPKCDCVKTPDGRDYKGTLNRTRSGRTCQSWSSQSPHKHRFTSLPNNYCRNPDGEPGAWCYTTDPQKRWELCGLPICECVKAADGIDYNGRRDKTQSGRTCQPWFSQFPHKHKFTSLPNNYCRNPDGEPGAWCYTTDPQKRWELCGVPVCECVKTADGRDYDGKRDKTQSGKTCQSWSSQYPHKHKFTSLPKNYCRNPDGEPGAWCYTTDPKKRWELCGVPKCDCVKTPDGRDYKGTLNRTRSGRTCQSWSSQSPHTHKFTSLPNNYCRNPDGEPGIWCYTTDPKKRWELCGVSKCDDI